VALTLPTGGRINRRRGRSRSTPPSSRPATWPRQAPGSANARSRSTPSVTSGPPGPRWSTCPTAAASSTPRPSTGCAGTRRW